MKILPVFSVRAFVLMLVVYGPVLGVQTKSQGAPAVNPDSLR